MLCGLAPIVSVFLEFLCFLLNRLASRKPDPMRPKSRLLSVHNGSSQCITDRSSLLNIQLDLFGDCAVKLSNDFSGALRTFAYFMTSGSHYMLEGIDYLSLYGNDPSAIEQAYAIFANVIELDETGQVLNFTHAQRRATDYIRSWFDPSFKVVPPFAEWETALYGPPPLKDKI